MLTALGPAAKSSPKLPFRLVRGILTPSRLVTVPSSQAAHARPNFRATSALQSGPRARLRHQTCPHPLAVPSPAWRPGACPGFLRGPWGLEAWFQGRVTGSPSWGGSREGQAVPPPPSGAGRGTGILHGGAGWGGCRLNKVTIGIYMGTLWARGSSLDPAVWLPIRDGRQERALDPALGQSGQPVGVRGSRGSLAGGGWQQRGLDGCGP